MREARLFSHSLLFSLSLALEFTNPPAFEATKDFSRNPVYKDGSLLKIKWSETTQNNTSLTLWQLNGTQFLQPFEYLTQGISGSVTSLDWAVQTTKNLTFSNMFYLCLFLEGDLSSLANSHYFNITSKHEDPDSETSTTTPIASITTGSTSLSTGVTTQSSTPRTNTAAVPTPATSSDSPTPSSETSNEMATGSKAAIGIGASVAGIMIIGIIWFCIKRQKRKGNQMPPSYLDSRAVHDMPKHHFHDPRLDIKKRTQFYELGVNRHNSSAPFELPGYP